MPVLPAVKVIQSQLHATGRHRCAYIPVPAHTIRHRWPTSDIGRLQILPYVSRPLFAPAGSHFPAGHYCEHGSGSPSIWMGISLRIPVNNHHLSGLAGRITAVPFPGQNMWHSSLPNNSFPSSRERPRGTDALLTHGRHSVPGAKTMDT